METEEIFRQEEATLLRAHDILQSPESAKGVLLVEYGHLVNAYGDLLAQTRMLTKISDRLQRKVDQTNHELSKTNYRLTRTIDDLMRAKLGRKATTLVFIIAIVLFIISEIIIEPRIDHMLVTAGSLSTYIGYGLKGLIALLIKPFEGFTEKKMIDRARKRAIEKREKGAVAED
ncbi:MAG TPA: hypothetical protein DCR43_05115 [Bacteroidales bacterium]|nr:MAG: hypothetical protein A2X11_10405 [Bacteroidetes bacterium GWE2_42_24]OFY32614.1 MAG: hypothetical protein A2X09_02465 [Bacteroidetes bacterium GWF2_43_11]HAQ65217.1 hypothetical protein [Bacteroidales bacterium]HBZ65555.1 hypothetical protein [Bacteroidales bacterium]